MNSQKILKAIGLNIRAAREKAGMTQEALAELVDVHWKTVGYIEGGYRDFGVATLARISITLKIPTGVIFSGIVVDSSRHALVQKATARKRNPVSRPPTKRPRR